MAGGGALFATLGCRLSLQNPLTSASGPLASGRAFRRPLFLGCLGLKTTAFDLQLNPANPGMSFHKLDKVKDKTFWSVRVNRDIRLIVHRSEASLLLYLIFGDIDGKLDVLRAVTWQKSFWVTCSRWIAIAYTHLL